MSTVWVIRVRGDAQGYYRDKPGLEVCELSSREDAEELRRAMPNGAEFETVEVENPYCDRGPCSNLRGHDGACSL